MAFDQATRNRLSKFVTDTRKLLSDEFSQQMRVKYGLDPATGVVTDIDKLPTMVEGDRQTAQMLRDTLEHYLASSFKHDKKTIAATIDRIVREQAFTVLNRMCAVRMAEARDLVIESIAQGTKSKGFQLYARLAGSALGETGEAYVCYMFSLFDELSIDLPVLFDRFSPSCRLFPKESVFLEILDQINHHELQHLWAEDETIGWVYQYFNSDEERKAMRDVKAGGSAAPRNSRELAVRNQFFTPRYVVEFLTDNTLGRIWFEMTQGQTRLVEECKYLVRRPDEVFLSQMTSKDREHPSQGTIAMAELLLSGTKESFPEFNARDQQPMIELAHCVSSYATVGDRAQEILESRTLIERSVHEPREVVDAVEAAPYVFAGQLETLKTKHILEVLFMTCRNDRQGGDGSVYSEPWFVDSCNEVRRRVLNSRRDDLAQEDLLRQPVFIPYRRIKDPRDIKMLDPACGSMHFGLYAFDLLQSIYGEAWELEELGSQEFERTHGLKGLQETYGSRDRFIQDIPRLIIERNIHGIDIDSRAVQIAGLSLWLRAQKAWHEAGVKPVNRPQITRSNIVCAEPMPGETDLLEQFIENHLSQTSEQETIASIVRRVFEAMKLAGEAGSLLKIEDEIADTIAEAKKKWVEGPKEIQLPLFAIDAKQKDTGPRPLLVAGIDDASFWDDIEEQIYRALKEYGTQLKSGIKRLFAEDAAQGFAFIDLCRKRYDVALMNPPFGDASIASKAYIDDTYLDTKGDVYKAFVECFNTRLIPNGLLGIISSRAGFFLGLSEDWRTRVVLRLFRPILLADLGMGVLDAMVEVAAYVLRSLTNVESENLTLSLVPQIAEVDRDKHDQFSIPKWQKTRGGLKRHQASAELVKLQEMGFIWKSNRHGARFIPIWERIRNCTQTPKFVFNSLICIRALADEDKCATLFAGSQLSSHDNVFVCDPGTFQGVPGTPFAYWVSRSFLTISTRFKSFEPNFGYVRVGVQTDNDPRFMRVWWEVNPVHVSTPSSDESLARDGWAPFLKGEESAPFNFDQVLVLNWRMMGKELKAATEDAAGGRVNNEQDYFKPGISWSVRTSKFSPHIVPAGCIPSVSRYLALVQNGSEFATVGLWNSTVMDAICKFRMERHGHPKFIVGVIKDTPFPTLDAIEEQRLKELVNEVHRNRARVYATDWTSHAFLLPAVLLSSEATLAKRHSSWLDNTDSMKAREGVIRSIIDDLAFKAYGLSKSDRSSIETNFEPNEVAVEEAVENTVDDAVDSQRLSECSLPARELVEYAIGCCFGRWDIRFASGERALPIPRGPLEPYPVCPPGMLQLNGLPITISSVESLTEYPISIAHQGIMVDDEASSLDLPRGLGHCLNEIWDTNADSVENEACHLLAVSSLREWVRRPRAFFADHLRRYTKSRRQAPVYWPLSTKSSSYTLWLYYPIVSEQTLLLAINDFVDPKIKETRDNITLLREKIGKSKIEEIELERLSSLASELEEFRNELSHVARFWRPNMDDGVQITAAPLWRFFQLKKWRDTLKKTWEELEEGKYDWAHLTLSIWPERVVRNAHKDRSIAIAHDLEDALWHEVEVKKSSKSGRVTVKKEWQQRELSETELDAIVQQVKSGEVGVASSENAAS
jgi:hypothetical protein